MVESDPGVSAVPMLFMVRGGVVITLEPLDDCAAAQNEATSKRGKQAKHRLLFMGFPSVVL